MALIKPNRHGGALLHFRLYNERENRTYVEISVCRANIYVNETDAAASIIDIQFKSLINKRLHNAIYVFRFGNKIKH